jgi:hypothetical protein
LSKKALRDAIDALFERFPVTSLELKGGELRAEIPFARFRSGEGARSLLELLGTVAGELDRIPLDVHVLGGERRALRSRSGHARCAYCHADVTGAEPDLVACGLCSTVLHAGCWEELGRCPVLGCEGKSPERAQVH